MGIEFDRQAAPFHLLETAEGRTCLVVDSDDVARAMIVAALEDGRLCTLEAANLAVARSILRTQDVGVVLVDHRLDGEDGMGLVHQLAGRPDIAVVIVSAAADPAHRILGIELGADDFVAKPFHVRELLARVKRRMAVASQFRDRTLLDIPDAPAQMSLAGWTLDEARQGAFDAGGTSAKLSETEFRTLYWLMRNRGRVLTRDEIHRLSTGQPSRPANDRSVDTAITALRKKLGVPNNRGIRTVHRVGYIVP